MEMTRGVWFHLNVRVCFNVLALSPIKEGLQQHEEGCDGRQVQVSCNDSKS